MKVPDYNPEKLAYALETPGPEQKAAFEFCSIYSIDVADCLRAVRQARILKRKAGIAAAEAPPGAAQAAGPAAANTSPGFANELKGTKRNREPPQEVEPIATPKPSASGCVSADVDDDAHAEEESSLETRAKRLKTRAEWFESLAKRCKDKAKVLEDRPKNAKTAGAQPIPRANKKGDLFRLLLNILPPLAQPKETPAEPQQALDVHKIVMPVPKIVMPQNRRP